MTDQKGRTESFILALTVGGFFLGAVGAIKELLGNKAGGPFMWICTVAAAICFLLGLLTWRLRDLRGIIGNVTKSGEGIEIRRANDDEIDAVHAIATRHFEAVTDIDKIHEIRARYPEGLQVAVSTNRNGKNEVIGYYFMFPISKVCVEKVYQFKFAAAELCADDIVDNPADAHAMYVGAVVSPSLRARVELMGAIKMASKTVESTATKTVFARAATSVGRKRLLDNGFRPTHPEADKVNCFYCKIIDGGLGRTKQEARRLQAAYHSTQRGMMADGTA